MSIGTKARILTAAALAAAMLAGCGEADGGSGSATQPTATATEKPTREPGQSAPPPASDSGATRARLWFTAGEQFHPVERELPPGGSTATEAVKALLDGPRPGEGPDGVPAETQIPPGVALQRLRVDGAGTVEVAFSPNFLEGVPTDPEQRDLSQRSDLNARLGQVTYTLTQFGDIDAAKVRVGRTVVNPDLRREEYAKPAAVAPPVRKPAGPKLPGTRQVQSTLVKLGYLPKSAVDGRAGYWTSQAVTAFQAWNGLGRDGVVGPMTGAALKTGTRPVPGKGGGAKRIEVYNDKGVTLLINGGKVKRAIHTSSGAPGTVTPTGRYTVTRKEINSWSVPFQTWLPYASYFNAGIALHEYADVPPYPASHGCVRVPAPEAKRVYAFAGLGTPVIVY